MGFWKDFFSGKSPEQQFKGRMAKENAEKRATEDKIGVRDKFIISKSFFQKQIDKCESNIDRKKKLHKEYVKEKGENADTSGLFDSFNIEILHLIGAKYSKGDSVESIKNDCPALMETVSRFWLPDSECDYSDGGDMNLIRLKNSVSLGILGEVDNSYFEELSQVMQEKGFSDYLIDYLVNSQIPNHPIGDKLIVEDNKSINFLVDIIKTEEKVEAEKKLQEYLEKFYYTKENLDYDYKTHEFEDGRIYFGYWCWEATALVKIKQLNDNLFRGNRFYPSEMIYSLVY